MHRRSNAAGTFATGSWPRCADLVPRLGVSTAIETDESSTLIAGLIGSGTRSFRGSLSTKGNGRGRIASNRLNATVALPGLSPSLAVTRCAKANAPSAGEGRRAGHRGSPHSLLSDCAGSSREARTAGHSEARSPAAARQPATDA